MIVPDANLLLYAYNTASPFHRESAAWLEGILSGDEEVGFCPPVLFAFVRISTHPKACPQPLPISVATSHVRSWLRCEVARPLEMRHDSLEKALDLLAATGTGGNLVTDAQIAAIAMKFQAVVHTADSDFGRFPGVRWVNPLSPG